MPSSPHSGQDGDSAVSDGQQVWSVQDAGESQQDEGLTLPFHLSSSHQVSQQNEGAEQAPATPPKAQRRRSTPPPLIDIPENNSVERAQYQDQLSTAESPWEGRGREVIDVLEDTVEAVHTGGQRISQAASPELVADALAELDRAVMDLEEHYQLIQGVTSDGTTLDKLPFKGLPGSPEHVRSPLAKVLSASPMEIMAASPTRRALSAVAGDAEAQPSEGVSGASNGRVYPVTIGRANSALLFVSSLAAELNRAPSSRALQPDVRPVSEEVSQELQAPKVSPTHEGQLDQDANALSDPDASAGPAQAPATNQDALHEERPAATAHDSKTANDAEAANEAAAQTIVGMDEPASALNGQNSSSPAGVPASSSAGVPASSAAAGVPASSAHEPAGHMPVSASIDQASNQDDRHTPPVGMPETMIAGIQSSEVDALLQSSEVDAVLGAIVEEEIGKTLSGASQVTEAGHHREKTASYGHVTQQPSVVSWWPRGASYLAPVVPWQHLPSVATWYTPRVKLGWNALFDRLTSASTSINSTLGSGSGRDMDSEEETEMMQQGHDEQNDEGEGEGEGKGDIFYDMPEKPHPARAGRVRDFPSVVTWRPPPPRMTRKRFDKSMPTGGCAEAESTAKVFAEDHSDDSAAVLLQRTVRGMIDRLFFRKIRDRHNKKLAAVSKKKVKPVHKANVLEMMEPDGYLSRTTQKRILERGEPLDKDTVLARSIKARSRNTATLKFEPSRYPGRGWCVGEVRSVRWSSLGTLPINRVGLYLYHRGQPVQTIVKSIVNLGKYIYNLPDDFEPDDDYQILVIAEVPKLPNVHSFTEAFAVLPRAPGMLSRIAPTIPTIDITFPMRPNFSWPCGSSYNIQWKDSGSIGIVQIDVVRRNVFSFRIVGSLLNVGGFQYAMPLDAPPGEGFQIRVRSATNKKAFALSTPFSIVDKEVASAVPRQPKEKPKEIRFGAGSPPRTGQDSKLLQPLNSPPNQHSLYVGNAPGRAPVAAWTPNGNLGAPSGFLPGFTELGQETGLEGMMVRPTDLPPTRLMKVAFNDVDLDQQLSRPSTTSMARRADSRGATRQGSRGGSRSREGMGSREEVLSRGSTSGKRMDLAPGLSEWSDKAFEMMHMPAGQTHMMAAALHGSQGRARTSGGGRRSALQSRDKTTERTTGGVMSSRERTVRIVNAAEEFLSLRDAMFSHQIELLREMGDGPARLTQPLPPLKASAGGASEVRRYSPAFQRGLLHGAARGEDPPTVAAQWAQYKGARADDAGATQAIEGLQNQIDNQLFNQPLPKGRY